MCLEIFDRAGGQSPESIFTHEVNEFLSVESSPRAPGPRPAIAKHCVLRGRAAKCRHFQTSSRHNPQISAAHPFKHFLRRDLFYLIKRLNYPHF